MNILKSTEHVLRLALSTILLSAGVLKIVDPHKSVDILLFFQVVEYAEAITIVYALSAIEIALAILLFAKVCPRFISFLVVGVCMTFLLVSIIGYWGEWGLACGCFGRFSFGRFDLPMVIRNGILLGMAIILFLNIPERISRYFKMKKQRPQRA